MSFEGGYQSDRAAPTKQGGAVFITDIEPQEDSENVASKAFSSGGLVLQSCSSSTDLIKVSILAITGFSTFKPIVTVENEIVSLVQDEDQNVWTGTIAIDLQGKTIVEAIHNDGAFHRCMIVNEQNPVVTDAFLSGGYPAGQTELKEDDSFSLQVEGSEAFTAIEVAEYGAAKAAQYPVAEAVSATINITIADKGNTPTAKGVRLRIVNANGTKSDWYSTELHGNTDGVNTVILNNTKPIINIQEIVYPENQLALKNDEGATVNHSISNYDSVLYASENAELNIAEPNSFAASKAVSRISGDYNVNQSNLIITASRAANGASTTKSVVIKIAHLAASISFEGNEKRLVSGGNNNTEAQSHLLSIKADQILIGLPQISVEEGLLQGQMQQVGNSNDYQQSILIHDNDEKGIQLAQLNQAVNLAGIVTSSFNNPSQYEIGGFVQRLLTFQEFSNETPIGTAVSEVSKIIAKDKDERLMTYAPNLENSSLTFTITQPANTLNPKGNIFHWNDEQAVNNNSTGLATVLIEELP